MDMLCMEAGSSAGLYSKMMVGPGRPQGIDMYELICMWMEWVGNFGKWIFFCLDSCGQCQGWWSDMKSVSWLCSNDCITVLGKKKKKEGSKWKQNLFFHEELGNSGISALIHKWLCVARLWVSSVLIIPVQNKILLWHNEKWNQHDWLLRVNSFWKTEDSTWRKGDTGF